MSKPIPRRRGDQLRDGDVVEVALPVTARVHACVPYASVDGKPVEVTLVVERLGNDRGDREYVTVRADAVFPLIDGGKSA